MIINRFIENGPFNLLVGAGISIRTPSDAPAWRDMLREFLLSLYEAMKLEKWSVPGDDLSDFEQLASFGFRPETFWERVYSHTGIDFVADVFGIVNLGKPNENHEAIAALVGTGAVRNVVTTNFDEYIESCAQNMTRVVRRTDIVKANATGPVLFKPHGTMDDKLSLKFTLEHTRELPDWKKDFLISCLSELPLLIAGYSGYDDDLMPELRKIAEKLPCIVIVSHPGSDPREPIKELPALRNAVVVEADLYTELRRWLRLPSSVDDVEPKRESTSHKRTTHYRKALTKIPPPLWPLLVSVLAEFAAFGSIAYRYARLAEDALDDKRYANSVSPQLQHQILQNLSLHASRSGDPGTSRFFAKKAQEVCYSDSPISSGVISELERVFELFHHPEFQHRQDEIEQAAVGALGMISEGVIHGDYISFRASWIMGRLRGRQGCFEEAIGYYQHARSLPSKVDAVQSACFFVDYGVCLLRYSASKRDGKALTASYQVLLEAEREALRAQDQLTMAQARMNLALVHTYAGERAEAIAMAESAVMVSQRTGDLALQARARKLLEDVRHA